MNSTYDDAVKRFDRLAADPAVAALIVATVGVARATWGGDASLADVPLGWIGGRVRNVLEAVGVWAPAPFDDDLEFALTSCVGQRADDLAQQL